MHIGLPLANETSPFAGLWNSTFRKRIESLKITLTKGVMPLFFEANETSTLW